MSSVREFSLLDRIYAANRELDSNVLVAPGDDMAMVESNSTRILAAVDQLVDGRHVRLEVTPMSLVGRKAVTRSLSDIAAMAARPLASLAAVAIPSDFTEERADALFNAVRSTAAAYGCPLVGGDIVVHRAPHPLACSVTVLATPVGDRVITRSGAQPGDTIYVTGRLGGSLDPTGLGRHLTFEPRIQTAWRLLETLGIQLHAMIDLSDGLGRDVSHIAVMSAVHAELQAALLPCHDHCDWRNALGDGEDYELCFAAVGPVPPTIDGIAVTAVGKFVAPCDGKPTVQIVTPNGVVDATAFGWQHTSE